MRPRRWTRGSPRSPVTPVGALGLDELDPPGGEGAHLEQEPAVAPALDVGLAVGALAVADRHLDELQVELGRPEQEVEIPEGIEVPEVGAVGGELLVVLPAQDLGAAEGVL